MITLNKDAFSSGQLGSKLWLVETLEKYFDSIDSISIYGGWYAVTAFLLLTRNNIKINKIKSIDIDPDCETIADALNEFYVWQDWKFKAYTADCNKMLYEPVDLVINTSTEHFESTAWFDNIPEGTCVALQGNNMIHDDHYSHFKSLAQFKKTYKLQEYLFVGEQEFTYPDWSFTRYMCIGTK